MINVFVPPEQVMDTVELFWIKGARKLSLRFLASYFLKTSIQDRTHDSIEDARCALLLFRVYEEFVKKGTLDEEINKLYAEGRKRNWKA